jgi:PiT family inorganic phosphate transporter
MTTVVVAVVLTALMFDFTNGFHDTANAMATSIATGALRPKVAVLISGVLNLVGAFLSIKVAETISSGLVQESKITPTVIFAGLIGAILWNLITWYLGLPSSSSHALFGGLIGAAWVAAGSDAVQFGNVISKVIAPAVLAPIVAGIVAFTGTYLAYRITRRARRDVVGGGFKIGQIVSGSMVSLAHGTNDAQKTMGVITLALIANGTLPSDASAPFWVILSCGLAIALGTYMGGWRIIRTLGKGLVEIESPQGVAAQSSSAAIILVSSHFGYSLSTTHVATGSIVGTGLGKKDSKVRWNVVGRLATGWLFTLPMAGLVGAGSYALASAIGGTAGVVVDGVLLLAAIAAIYLRSRTAKVSHQNVNEEWTGTVVPAGSEPIAA